VCEQVYRTQKAARREPDVRLLDEQAGRARRDESVKRHEARAETNRFLERLDTKMDTAFSEFRSDIKTLLQRKGD
jgi:hypothetical protein